MLITKLTTTTLLLLEKDTGTYWLRVHNKRMNLVIPLVNKIIKESGLNEFKFNLHGTKQVMDYLWDDFVIKIDYPRRAYNIYESICYPSAANILGKHTGKLKKLNNKPITPISKMVFIQYTKRFGLKEYTQKARLGKYRAYYCTDKKYYLIDFYDNLVAKAESMGELKRKLLIKEL